MAEESDRGTKLSDQFDNSIVCGCWMCCCDYRCDLFLNDMMIYHRLEDDFHEIPKYWKENNTKRNSKTYKRVIGHIGQLKHQNCEMINVTAKDKEHFTTFINRFLPQYSEINNWINNWNGIYSVSYSLKKRKRWNILKDIENVWRECSEELADMEEDVMVSDLGPGAINSRYEHGFKRLFRNHGQLVEKTKRGKKKGSVIKWTEGDPTKVEVVASRKNQHNYLQSRRSNYISESEIKKFPN